MSGKKAKSAPSKKNVAYKAAAKAPKGPKSKSPKPQAPQAKSGAIGSIKKMLGLASKDSAKKEKLVAGKKALESKAKGKPVATKPGKTPVAPPAKLTGKGAKGAAPVATGKPGRPPKGAVIDKALAKGAAKGGERQGAPVSGPPVCREVACELIATTSSYCRMHYIKNWKKIKRKLMILQEKKLNSYIEELVSKYPDKYIEAIRQDLASEKDFAKVIADLEIEEGLDDFESVETESAEGIIDNLKRDFEDEGDVF